MKLVLFFLTILSDTTSAYDNLPLRFKRNLQEHNAIVSISFYNQFYQQSIYWKWTLSENPKEINEELFPTAAQKHF